MTGLAASAIWEPTVLVVALPFVLDTRTLPPRDAVNAMQLSIVHRLAPTRSSTQ